MKQYLVTGSIATSIGLGLVAFMVGVGVISGAFNMRSIDAIKRIAELTEASTALTAGIIMTVMLTTIITLTVGIGCLAMCALDKLGEQIFLPK